jgi:L-lactate dehydrogenase (cytochrome)
VANLSFTFDRRPPSARIGSYDDARALAKRRLPKMVFEFVDGGAGGEVSLRANRAAFERVSFDPRWLTDVSHRDTSTTVLGEKVAMPLLLAPAGLAGLVHPQGELDVARAAGRAGTIFCISTASSYTVEEIADAATGPLWFQIYLWKSDEVVKGLIDRAAAAGYKALVLTIDVPATGNRERDLRNGIALPPRLSLGNALDVCRRPGWLRGLVQTPTLTFANLAGIAGTGDAASIPAYAEKELVDPTASWDRLDWLRRVWDGPLVVKGVLSARDAEEAVRRGADAVYVSNHGGRQLDSSPATLDVLPEVVAAVGDRAEVYIDGGIRRGEDVVKARALGAQAAFAGRPWFHALAAGGAAGVERLLEVIRLDIDRTLALVGVPRIDDVTADALRPR